MQSSKCFHSSHTHSWLRRTSTLPTRSSTDFFQNQLFRKTLSGIPSVCQRVWIQIRPDILSGLIWVQTVCRGYQQMTKVGRVKAQAMSMSSSVYLSRYLQHKIQLGMWVQGRFKSVWTTTQSDQSLSFLPEEMLDPCLPIERPLKTSNQTLQMRRLIWVFDGRINL